MGKRRRRIVRGAVARHRIRHAQLERLASFRDADVEEWRQHVFAAARVLAARLPETASDFVEVIFDEGPRRWWRLFRRARPIVGWQIASFKFWEPDPEGKAVPAYAPGTLWVDMAGVWVAEIGLAGWMVRQADAERLNDLVPGDVLVEALAKGVGETAQRYWIDIPEIPTQPD